MLANPPRAEAFTFAAANRRALARELSRVADLAPWLSDGEIHDLACQAGRAAAGPGQIRAGLVASTQDQLARVAREAVALLPGLRPGKLAMAPGIAMADGGRGRVVLLFPGEGACLPGPASATRPNDAGTHDPALHPAVLAASLAGLRWLEDLEPAAAAGVGHGLGEITGLVWAGCLAEPDAVRLVAQRAALLASSPAGQTALVCVDTDGPKAEHLCAASGLVIAAYNGPRCHVLAGPVAAVRDLARRLAEAGVPARLLDAPRACYSPAMADRVAPMRSVLREFAFRPPSRRLLSTITGTDVAAADDIGALLCAQMTSPVAFAGALGLATADADLLIETGPGQGLSCLAADCCDVPALSLAAGPADDDATAQVAAALFASGAVATLAPLSAARPARPIDIWRERVFIPSPCGTTPTRGAVAAESRDGQRGAKAQGGRAARQHAGGRPGATPAGLAARDAGLDTAPTEAGPPKAAGPAASVKGEDIPGASQDTPAAGAQPGGTTAPQQRTGTGSRPATSKATRPTPARALSRDHEQDPPGAGPWIRCFTEERRPAPLPEPPAAAATWRLMGGTDTSFGKLAGRTFAGDPDAATVLALVSDPAEPAAWAGLLGAAREAAGTGRLVVITAGPGLTGVCASLHAEHTGLGITLIQTAPTEGGLESARRFALATPGRFREVIVDEAGVATEPVMVPGEPDRRRDLPARPGRRGPGHRSHPGRRPGLRDLAGQPGGGAGRDRPARAGRPATDRLPGATARGRRPGQPQKGRPG